MRERNNRLRIMRAAAARSVGVELDHAAYRDYTKFLNIFAFQPPNGRVIHRWRTNETALFIALTNLDVLKILGAALALPLAQSLLVSKGVLDPRQSPFAFVSQACQDCHRYGSSCEILLRPLPRRPNRQGGPNHQIDQVQNGISSSNSRAPLPPACP